MMPYGRKWVVGESEIQSIQTFGFPKVTDKLKLPRPVSGKTKASLDL